MYSLHPRSSTKYHEARFFVVDNNRALTKYLNGPGIDNKLRMQTGSDVKYFIVDHLGSTNALTDSSGNVTSSATYDSFGNATGNLATRYKFTGREYDDFTGLHYYRARWYDGDPHGEGMNPRFQTIGVKGHTFYGGILSFIDPNTMDLSGSPCITDSQFSSALLWDSANMPDPVGITNVVDAYTGLDGGYGGLSGIRQLTIDMNPILMPVDVGTKKLGELIYGA